MATAVFRLDTPVGDADAAEKERAHQGALEFFGQKPGNVTHVELVGKSVATESSRYLLLVEVDIDNPSELVPAGS